MARISLSAFGKFLGHHAGDLMAIADVLRAVAPALPLGSGDKEVLTDAIDKLENSAVNVAKAAPKTGEANATIDAKTIEAAVAKALPALIAKELERLGIKKTS